MVRIPNFALRTVLGLRGEYACRQRGKPKRFGPLSLPLYKGGADASISISADFELNWAWRELHADDRDKRGRSERENVPEILAILASHRIPVTWATVGHLCLKSCSPGSEGKAHHDMPRPPQNKRWDGDWYVHDPTGESVANPLWFAPDLVELILEAKEHHELACHSFSHIDFSPGFASQELVEQELRKCSEVMSDYCVKPRSLVFPFNRMGYQYLPALASSGTIAVRHRDEVFRLSFPERTPFGVYKIYETVQLRNAVRYDYVERVKQLIWAAINEGAAFHLWFHPSDPLRVFRNEFNSVLSFASRMREEGRVWISTMSELASYCEMREATRLDVSQNGELVDVNVTTLLDSQRFDTPELTIDITGQGFRDQVIAYGPAGRFEIMARTTGWKNTQLFEMPFGTQRLILKRTPSFSA